MLNPSSQQTLRELVDEWANYEGALLSPAMVDARRLALGYLVIEQELKLLKSCTPTAYMFERTSAYNKPPQWDFSQTHPGKHPMRLSHGLIIPLFRAQPEPRDER